MAKVLIGLVVGMYALTAIVVVLGLIGFAMLVAPIILVVYVIKKLYEWILRLPEAFKQLQAWVKKTAESMRESFINLIYNISNFFASLPETIKNMGQKAYEAGKNFVLQLWQGVKDMWSQFIGWFDEKWNGITAKLNIFVDEDQPMPMAMAKTNLGVSQRQQELNTARTANMSQKAGMQTVNNETTNTTEQANTFTFQLDGETIMKLLQKNNEVTEVRENM